MHYDNKRRTECWLTVVSTIFGLSLNHQQTPNFSHSLFISSLLLNHSSRILDYRSPQGALLRHFLGSALKKRGCSCRAPGSWNKVVIIFHGYILDFQSVAGVWVLSTAQLFSHGVPGTNQEIAASHHHIVFKAAVNSREGRASKCTNL